MNQQHQHNHCHNCNNCHCHNQNKNNQNEQRKQLSPFQIKLRMFFYKLKREFRYQQMMLCAYLFLLIPGGKVVLLVERMFRQTILYIPMVLLYLYNYLWLIGTLIYLNAVDAGTMPKFAPFPFKVKDFYNVKYKGQLLPRNTCLTCGLVRPLRTSHCRLCNRCVNEFDHHCGWTGNCVGRRNKGRFLLFVTNVFLNSLFALVVSVVYLCFFETYSVGETIFIAIIAFMFSLTTLALGSLFVQHVYLSLVGRTTYEKIKDNKLKKEKLQSYLKKNGVVRKCNCRQCRERRERELQEKLRNKFADNNNTNNDDFSLSDSFDDSSSSDDSSSDDDMINGNEDYSTESARERRHRLKQEFNKMDDKQKRNYVKQLKKQFNSQYKMDSPYLSGFANLWELLFRSTPPLF